MGNMQDITLYCYILSSVFCSVLHISYSILCRFSPTDVAFCTTYHDNYMTLHVESWELDVEEGIGGWEPSILAMPFKRGILYSLIMAMRLSIV